MAEFCVIQVDLPYSNDCSRIKGSKVVTAAGDEVCQAQIVVHANNDGSCPEGSKPIISPPYDASQTTGWCHNYYAYESIRTFIIQRYGDQGYPAIRPLLDLAREIADSPKACDINQKTIAVLSQMLNDTKHPLEVLRAIRACFYNRHFNATELEGGSFSAILTKLVVNQQFFSQRPEDSEIIQARLDYIYTWLENHENLTAFSVQEVNSELDFTVLDAFDLFGMTRKEHLETTKLATTLIKQHPGKNMKIIGKLADCWKKLWSISRAWPEGPQSPQSVRVNILAKIIEKSSDSLAALSSLLLLLNCPQFDRLLLQQLCFELASTSKPDDVLKTYLAILPA